MKKQGLLDIILVFLIGLFFYASFSKYADMDSFQRSMRKQPFYDWFNLLLVWTLPPAEILVGLLLIFERTRLAGLQATLGIMMTFSLYIFAILLHLFGKVPCSCGGIIQQLGWGGHLLFNLFFVLIAYLGIRLQKQLLQLGKEKC